MSLPYGFHPLPESMSETQFQNLVIHTAKIRGWRVNHQLPSQQRSGKWATATQGHTGFPDLVLARDGVVMFRELKTNIGRLTVEQKAWRDVLGPLWGLWRPRDWAEVLEQLGPVPGYQHRAGVRPNTGPPESWS